MMITIHGLPPPTKYADLKVLIKQKCNITDFILDSLMSDGTDGTKKVRVGLADDSEGSHLMKCLDGYRLSGYALRVVPVAKSSQANHPQKSTYDDHYQQSNDYNQPNQIPDRSRQAEAPRPAAWANQPGNQWQANQATQPSAQNTYNYEQQQPTYGHNVNQPIKPQFEQREVMQPSHRAQQNQAYSHSYSQKSNLISLGPQRNAPSNAARGLTEAASRPMQGGRFAPQQNYDMPDKPPLRSVAGSAGREGPVAGARFPSQQNYNMPDKPLTIMKDNFQGPTQYNLLGGREPAPAPYAPPAPSPWASQHQPKPFEKPIPPFEKKPYDDRKYPPIGPIKPVDDLPKPDPFKGYDRPREFSPRRQERGYPPRRDISPERAPPSGRISPGRRVSPGRRISPDRRITPERQAYMDRRSPGRRISPHGRKVFVDNRRASPGRVVVSERRISPSGRHIQVTERAPSPPRRRISPPRNEQHVRGSISPPSHSPVDRRMRHAPGGGERDDARGPHARRESPRRQAMRYSPTRHRHHGDKPVPMEYQDNRPSIKNVRPAYEPPTQASNEAKYSGGYRPNVREDVHYPVRGQERWQEKEFARKDPEDRRDTIRLQKFDIPRVPEHEPIRSRSGNRLSRSPRRDRSPLNRVRRHSPSPRSPRRSWALEKRRSPEMREPPPPPMWPGQDNKNPNYQHPGRPNFSERDHEKTSPVWQSSSNKKIINDEFIRQRNADREHFEEEMRRRQADVKWKPLPQMSPKGTSSRYTDEDRALRDDKFARKGFEDRRDYREDHELSSRRDRDDSRYEPDFEMEDDIPRKKEVYPGRIEERKKEILKKQEQLQKEIDEVYKRAVDFTKKAELYRKGELKKDSSFVPSRHDEDSSDSEASYEGYSRKDRKDYNRSRHESSERKVISNPQKSKRDTAIEQIADKLMSSHGSHLPNDLKSRVVAELQLSVSNILKKMFGNQDVSFIEMVIKFNSHHTVEDEERIFDAVMSDFPAQFRRPKKPAKDDSAVPAKSSRRSDDPNLNAEAPGRRLCPKKLGKKRLIDFKGATPVAKKHKLHVEAPQDGDSGKRVALDERTTQILEEELQAIMIKVWQALPDEPPTPAERYVTEQLRSEASDDIRNVLGLNVTKRLLNVFNPLTVRINFPAKPDGRELMEFTKAYHITEIRTKGRMEHSYFALVARIADFDRLCNSKDLRCGSLTATVYPYYRFSDLPMKLNTGFIKKRKITSKSKQGEKEVADKEIIESSSNDKIINKATASSENVVLTVKSKPIVKSDLPPKKTIEQKNELDNNKVTSQSNINKVNVAKKADANQKVEQNTKNIATSGNQYNATPTKATEPKPNVVKGIQNVEKASTQNNPPKAKPTQITQEANTVKNVKVGITSTPVSKPKPNQANQAVVATKNVTNAAPKTTAATNLAKPKPNQVSKESLATKKAKESTPNLLEKVTVSNKKRESTPKAVKVAEKSAVTKRNQNQIKKVVTAKKIEEAKQKLSMKNIEMINSEMFDQDEEINEDDEMNDEEILALISTGVVVDECSGSDED